MKKETNDVINRILAGESTTEDEIFLIDWLGENDENKKEFAGRERLWNAMDIILNRNKYDHRTAFNKFISTVNRPRKKISEKQDLSVIIKTSLRWAAIGIMLIGLGSVISWLLIDHISTLHKTDYKVTVPTGSRSNIKLTDGTSVWLNAGSSLRYSEDFGKGDRTVYLEGEGYFNVDKKKDHPFTVITSKLEIVAQGTSFNVKSYPEEGIIQTTLVSGSLQVNRSEYKALEKGILLEPNQQITYYTDSRELLFTFEKDEQTKEEGLTKPAEERKAEPDLPRIILSRGVDPEIYTSWKDNRLIFDNEPFESIAVKLERRFGARIIIKDEDIRNKKFKGRFDEITIEQALSALKFASPFEFHIKQDTIFITSE